MQTDWNILLATGAFIVALSFFTEYLSRRHLLPRWFCRKLLHIGAVGACAVLPAWLQELNTLTWLVALAEPLLLYLVITRQLFSEADGRRSWGIALFPIAYLILLLAYPMQRWLIILPMMILALSDAAAAIAGHLMAKRYFQLTGDRKSLPGSLTFALSVPIVSGICLYSFPPWMAALPSNTFTFWLGLCAVALLLATIEALGSNGSDNLWTPLGAALLLQQLVANGTLPTVLWFYLGIVGALVFIGFTLRRKSLTLDGSIVAALLGLWVWWFAGPMWLLPLLFFFVTSTLLGRLHKTTTAATDAKHGQARNYLQVLCNGGVYAALATLLPWSGAFVGSLMLLSMAIATADTWSSEVGIYFRWRTFDVLRWRPVPAGLSGGVSVPGTIAGLGGSFAVGFLFYNAMLFTNLQLNNFLLIALGGFAGMLLDSLLGAALQARYRHALTNSWSDTPREHATLYSGYTWMSNDAVNFWSNLLIISLFLLLNGWS